MLCRVSVQVNQVPTFEAGWVLLLCVFSLLVFFSGAGRLGVCFLLAAFLVFVCAAHDHFSTQFCRPCYLCSRKMSQQVHRLYSRATITGYRRGGPSNGSHKNHISLLSIEGVHSKEDAQFYCGKRVAFIYKVSVRMPVAFLMSWCLMADAAC